MRKHEEFSYLKTIIRDLLGVDVLEDKSRVQQVVNAKMIYAYILKEKGYGCSVIAKSMGMNHATVLHYFKTIPWYLKSDIHLRKNYDRIKKEYYNETDPVSLLSENELKTDIISLKIKNKNLSSEIKRLNSVISSLTKNKEKLQDLFKCVENRTRKGTEQQLLYKLNRFYNGVYDK